MSAVLGNRGQEMTIDDAQRAAPRRPPRRAGAALAGLVAAWLAAGVAAAGPPYLTDDPVPTDTGHFEIYAFDSGAVGRAGHANDAGIELSYGGATDLQLTLGIPFEFGETEGITDPPRLRSISLGAKYRFLHQDEDGWDVAVFPAASLPISGSPSERRTTIQLPLWLERDWDKWAAFGGGGVAFNHGADGRNFWFAGWALTYQLTSELQLGAEIFYQSADTAASRASTHIGLGAKYDLGETLHLVGSIGPSIQRADSDDRYQWYAALLVTF